MNARVCSQKENYVWGQKTWILGLEVGIWVLGFIFVDLEPWNGNYSQEAGIWVTSTINWTYVLFVWSDPSSPTFQTRKEMDITDHMLSLDVTNCFSFPPCLSVPPLTICYPWMTLTVPISLCTYQFLLWYGKSLTMRYPWITISLSLDAYQCLFWYRYH